MSATLTPSVEAYAVAFERERLQQYPMVDAFERRNGYAIDSGRILSAARVLACPLKANAPNWQHGRVLYAAARNGIPCVDRVNMIDVGTAKGFSALCLRWALDDAGVNGTVTSLDVIDPESRERRNTVAEVDGLKTLAEILAPWPEAKRINFVKATGQKWLQEHTERVHVAFIDGKHSYQAVSWEAALLAERQQSGDLVMFDDAQIDGVAKALKELRSYELEYLQALPNRKYAIGRCK